MKQLQETVLNCIYQCGDDDRLVNELQTILDGGDKRAYTIFFHAIARLDLDPDKAQHCWQAILEHREVLSAKLGRRINLKTVICDYFSSVDKLLKNPVVELHVFESPSASSKYDALTGFYSRTTFEENLSREIARAKRYETNLSLLFLNLDDFKGINDSFGLLAGDQILKDVGEIVKKEIRAEDSVARCNSEGIAIVLPQTGKVDALVLGERIRKNVELLTFDFNGRAIQPTISGGVASYPIDAQNANDLIKYAVCAMHRVQEFGKNNIAIYFPNKRRYLRMNFFEKIQIRKIGFDDCQVPVVAVSKNISVAGILFESDGFFDIGSKIELCVTMPDREAVFALVGIVVRVEIFHSKRYEIGVSFLELDKEAKNEISRYILRQLESR